MDTRVLHAGVLKARESVCEVGRFKFIVRRPTQMQQLLRGNRHKGNDLEVANESIENDVIGWEGVLESDLKQDGAAEAAPFDPALYRAWVGDRPDVALAIWEHITQALAGYQTRLGVLQGN